MKRFWLGLACGALVGAVLATLVAPQSGKSTRKKLLRSLEDLGDNLSAAADYLREQAKRIAEETQDVASTGTDQPGEVAKSRSAW